MRGEPPGSERESVTRSNLDRAERFRAEGGKAVQIDLYILDMTENEREIVKAGSLINFNKNRKAKR